ncbi:Ca2+/H+ antiporter [Lineolata rhizophorae]|uniref:Vacuolar calcium ion transporter n=1 Tax=Lineolata rhizophorae TaxID=578093 RepID=A0A6A6NUK9_9PEZI|nr:Ca2+/H+ antiporter [Lineolata rhizophorae]
MRRSREYDAYAATSEPKYASGASSTVPPHSRHGHRPGHGHGGGAHSHLPLFLRRGSRHGGKGGLLPNRQGESGRSGVHPWMFLKICFRSASSMSMLVNVLWPAVPAAIAIHFARPDLHLAIFVLNYIAMVPAANTLGFSAQELARKLPTVLGVMLETTFGSVVEIVLFMVFISRGEESVQIIKAAILGSILANLLLCLGSCFLAGGFRRDEQTFHEAVSETGSGLMLVAGMALVIPAAFANGLGQGDAAEFEEEVLKISRAAAIVLLIAFFVWVWYQAHSHHGLYEEILIKDEHKDEDRHEDLAKPKLTFTECCLALGISLACVSMIAVFLVEQIHWIVEERGVKDAFVGLILIPVVEKAAEHLTAVDEAYDNQMNFALSHVLGASIQTALLNTPLVVIVGWGLDVHMDLRFEVFDAVVLILAILVVGSFLRDKKSNYLEGALCVLVYVLIAVVAFYYPNPSEEGGEEGGH